MKEYPWGKGTPTWYRDAAANDSDKSFTVPTGKVRRLLSVHAEIECTATVGNRVLSVTLTDGTNTLWTSRVTGSIAATQFGAILIYPEATTDATNLMRKLSNTGNVNVSLIYPCAPFVLPAGYVLRVYDAAAIDAAGDDLTVVLHYVEYDA